MAGYSARQVAEMLGLSVATVRAYVRAGFLAPDRGARGEMRFSFQDLVLLRTASGLVAARVPARRVRRALRLLREQLPGDRPLTGVHIRAEGNRIVVRDGGATWQPESGQVLFDFRVADLAAQVAPLAPDTAAEAPAAPEAPAAEAWYRLGCELEDEDPTRARAAYRRALTLDAAHGGALVNLGRLLHADGDAEAAATLYQRALAGQPEDATAAFNLGVALEDLDRIEEACAAYERATTSDPTYADAHYNLALCCERLGRRMQALRHLKTYRQLTRA